MGRPPDGLRERKKQQMRDALASAAFDLFARKGVEATTVDEIADEVMVSPRTFFRYFASKEDVALQAIDQQYSAVFEAFEARPPDEPVMTALRNATIAVLRACEAGESALPAERLVCVARLLSDSPSLAGRSLELCSSRVDELAGMVAARMGVSPTDPRPTLVAAVATSAVQTAAGAWRDQEPDTPPSELVDRAFALLEAGINYPARTGRR